MPDPKRERDRLRQRNRQLQAELDNMHAVVGWLDPRYTAALRELADLAIHGVRRPADLGGPIITNHAASRPPCPQPNKAYDLLRKDRVDQRRRAAELERRTRRIVDGDHEDEAPNVVRLCADG
jgi:hypothetical protein